MSGIYSHNQSRLSILSILSKQDEPEGVDDLSELQYSPWDIKNVNLHLDEVLPHTVSTIRVAPPVQEFYQEKAEFVQDFIPSVFWLVQTQLCHPELRRELKSLKYECGKKWAKFLFPLEVSRIIDKKMRDEFIQSFPFYAAQAIQHMCILVTRSNMKTVDKDFRIKICRVIVPLFTGITPLDSQLDEIMCEYFQKLPPVEFREEAQEAPAEKIEILLPIEDTKTLTEMQRRKRPRNTEWNMSGISPLIAYATGYRSVPFEHDAHIVVQYPAGNEEDWTTKLPPLLPPPEPQRGEKYNPTAESRSLLHRSRRPHLCDSIQDKHQALENLQHENKIRQDQHVKEVQTKMQQVLDADPTTKQKFMEQLRALQLDRKHFETPDIAQELVNQQPKESKRVTKVPSQRQISQHGSQSSMSRGSERLSLSS